MRKLLIADSNEEFRLVLAESLQQHFHVLSCGNGLHTLELLQAELPQLLILDPMLPELDGITLLETAAAKGPLPVTIIASAMLNDYVCSCMSRLNIQYMVRKPCSIPALTARILDLSQDTLPRPKPTDSRERISTQLQTLSVNPRHDGYDYMLDAIPLLMDRPDIAITKELYPQVAKQHNCQWQQVERSIRSAIESAWKHRNPQIWAHYFPNFEKRPSNSDFLYRMAEELLRENE